MTTRMERRRISRVALSGTLTVWTHDGVAARLLDLSLHGARLAHTGTLRPGARCLVHLPTELGSFRLPAQILWCTILGAAVGLDGERYLQAQSGLAFPGLSEAQRTGLTGLLQQARTGEIPRREDAPQAGDPARDFPRLTRGGAAVRLPGQTGRDASALFPRLVGSRRPGSLASGRAVSDSCSNGGDARASDSPGYPCRSSGRGHTWTGSRRVSTGLSEPSTGSGTAWRKVPTLIG